jgi:CheY-like chemotaxis protein
MLMDDLEPDDPKRNYVNQILKAALRSRDLVSQLLAFSRRQIMAFKPLDLNQTVTNFKKLLRRTIPEDIEIIMILAENLPAVMADIGQVEQVLMNLAVNAADAMPNGGRLTIETSLINLDETYMAEHLEAEPGKYAVLCLSDTGEGMDADTCQHVFEPFFSTKGDQGTGLGLATVYGIVKQHGGQIWVYSEKGRGTTFKVYLPVTDQAHKEKPKSPSQQKDPAGSETIMLVEDNEEVRQLTYIVLNRLGYQVLVASDASEALTAIIAHSGRIDLLLTDVVMPGLNGRELYQECLKHYPQLEVLYMSGYTNNIIAHRGVLDQGINFIQKPFSVGALAAKIREILEYKKIQESFCGRIES